MAKILIIDDEDTILKLVSRILQPLGHEINTALNGNIGIELFKQKNHDLIITDLSMPEKEGIETILELKEMNKNVKIIAISGKTYKETMDLLSLANLLGAIKTLKKPFSKEAITEAVQEALK